MAEWYDVSASGRQKELTAGTQRLRDTRGFMIEA